MQSSAGIRGLISNDQARLVASKWLESVKTYFRASVYEKGTTSFFHNH